MQVTGVTSIVIMGVLPTGLLPRGLVADAGLTDGAHSMIDAIARHLEGGDADPARERAIGLFMLLVRSLQLASAAPLTQESS